MAPMLAVGGAQADDRQPASRRPSDRTVACTIATIGWFGIETLGSAEWVHTGVTRASG